MKKLILFVLILAYINVNADNKWVIPTKKICKKNNGKVSKFLHSNKYECKASYSNAIDICSAMNGFILPTVNDVKELIKSCGGKIPVKKDYKTMGENHSNQSYQSCLEKKKLYTTYWLSNKKQIYFDNGEIQKGMQREGVACVNPTLSIPSSSQRDDTQNYTSSQTNSKETSITKSSSAQTWSSIDYEELYKLISGNTLISKNKLFCSRNSSKDSCLKIAILEPSKSFHIGRVKATVILPDKKKIIDDEWGYYAVNAFHIGIHTGITKIPTNSSQYRWDDIVKMNSEKNMIKISNGNIEILISIQQGQNKKLIANARNGNYKKFDYTGSMTIGQALVGKAVEKIGESLAEVGKKPPSNESYCYSSDIKSDRDRQMCLAISKGDKTYCFSSDIKNDRDRQMCIASATRDDNYCYSSDIKNDRDRQMCLATTTRDKNYCYSSDIKNDRDQAMCLASATGDKNYCYSSDITSDRDRQMCLAQTR